MIKQLEMFIERNKEGALLGGLIGGLIYLTRDKYPTITDLSSKIFPNYLEGIYLLGAIVFICMSIGILIDASYKPRR
jgi:hypothetical protein